jgi:hypothetical protein
MEKKLAIITGSLDLANSEALKTSIFEFYDTKEKTTKQANLLEFVSGCRSLTSDMKDAEKVLSEKAGHLSDMVLGIRKQCPELSDFEAVVKGLRDTMKWGKGDDKIGQPTWFRDYVSLIISSEKNLGIVAGKEMSVTRIITDDLTGIDSEHTVTVTPDNINTLKRLSKVVKANKSPVKKLSLSGFGKDVKTLDVKGEENEAFLVAMRAVTSLYVTGGDSVKGAIIAALTALDTASGGEGETVVTPDKAAKAA